MAASNAMGFDISGATGTAYLSFDANNTPNSNNEFYKLNLATGAATFAGQFGVAMLDISVSTISAVPEPATLALMFGGLAVVGASARRRHRRLQQP